MSRHMEEQLGMPLRDLLPIMQFRITQQSTYFGVRALKSPLDSWIYQELIHELQPDVIVEIGNAFGGGLLALAHLCDLLGNGRFIGVDVDHSRIHERVRNHSRITLIEGDACESFPRVERSIAKGERVLVIDDSSHTYEDTLRILRSYSDLIAPGDYIVVEDTICHHGLPTGPDPGPYEAVVTFVKESRDFEIDRDKESFLITWNPKGYLRRRLDSVPPVRAPQDAVVQARRRSFRETVVLFIPPIIHMAVRKMMGLR